MLPGSRPEMISMDSWDTCSSANIGCFWTSCLRAAALLQDGNLAIAVLSHVTSQSSVASKQLPRSWHLSQIARKSLDYLATWVFQSLQKSLTFGAPPCSQETPSLAHMLGLPLIRGRSQREGESWRKSGRQTLWSRWCVVATLHSNFKCR